MSKDIHLHLHFKHVPFSELNEEQKNLVEKCVEKSHLGAYAPYSGFKVGAAALLESGEIVMGSNQENMAYPSGLCAERTLIFYCGSQFPEEKITKLAVYTPSFENQEELPYPCGACRQVLMETERRQTSPIEILMINKAKEILLAENAEMLLPLPFKF